MATTSLEEFAVVFKRHIGDGGQVVFFLGAGCSRRAGIPTADEMSALWAEELGCPPGAFAVMAERRFATVTVRGKAFRDLCAGTKMPTDGHRALAGMYAEFPAQMRLCLTTNFDGLIEAALSQRNVQDGNRRFHRAHFTHTEETAKQLRQHLEQHEVSSVLKLHGDALSAESIASITMHELPLMLAEPVRAYFHKHPTMLVFVGYSGRDANIVPWLRGIDVDVGSVFWCSNKEPDSYVAPLLREKKYTRVACDDFDAIMVELGM